jgi:hypothetical protein
MLTKLRITPVLLAFTIAASSYTQAKEYLSFDLGKTSKTEVMAMLNKNKANYSTNYGYQGYANDLPIIKVNHYQGFSKHGQVNNAWLYFTPNNQLYKISVEYADAGAIHKVFSDSLKSKYGLQKQGGFGFSKTQQFRDDNVNITLTRNEFGFGKDQKTTLEYQYQPYTQKVEQMKVNIDKDIAKKNASKAGDL